MDIDEGRPRGKDGPPSITAIDEIYRAHKEGREEDAARLRGNSPEYRREHQEVKHLTTMHSRNPLSDKGMKLMHGIGDKYAHLLERFQQLQDDHDQLKLDLIELVALRERLDETEAKLERALTAKAALETQNEELRHALDEAEIERVRQVTELEAEIERVRREMAEERALLQRMLDELKVQFDQAMAREQRAIEECRRLTEENVEIREKFATQMAAMQELRSQYDELLARETHLRVQVERLSTENTKVREALAAERAANERMQADLTRQLQESRARESKAVEEAHRLAHELTQVKEQWSADRTHFERVNGEIKVALDGSQERENRAMREAEAMAQEMQRFFEQAKVQMEEFKRSETRLLEENQQLKIAMSRLDGAHKELKHSNLNVTDENKRLKEDLTMSHTANMTNWADREVGMARTQTRAEQAEHEVATLRQHNMSLTATAADAASVAASATARYEPRVLPAYTPAYISPYGPPEYGLSQPTQVLAPRPVLAPSGHIFL